jgi:hypothetical protein
MVSASASNSRPALAIQRPSMGASPHFSHY